MSAFFYGRREIVVEPERIIITKRRQTWHYTWDMISDLSIGDSLKGHDIGSPDIKLSGPVLGENAAETWGAYFGTWLAYLAKKGSLSPHIVGTVVIRTIDGRKHEFDDRVSYLKDLCLTLAEHYTSALSAKQLDTMTKGNHVVLYDSNGQRSVVMTPYSLANDRDEIPWEAVLDIQEEEGQLIINTANEQQSRMQFNVLTISLQGMALIRTIRAKSPALRAKEQRWAGFITSPISL